MVGVTYDAATAPVMLLHGPVDADADCHSKDPGAQPEAGESVMVAAPLTQTLEGKAVIDGEPPGWTKKVTFAKLEQLFPLLLPNTE